VTEFGSFDNSTCKRVLDLLKAGDLTLGQVVIKRVAVVELGVKDLGLLIYCKGTFTQDATCCVVFAAA